MFRLNTTHKEYLHLLSHLRIRLQQMVYGIEKIDPFEADNLCDSTDPDIAALIEILLERYALMLSQSEAVRSGVASPEVIEELKALGYL